MRENEDFVFVINWVRNVLEKFEKETPVKAYPSGYPFTFWQQYVTLRFWLFIALACVIFAVFLVLTIVLVNPWSAFIMVSNIVRNVVWRRLFHIVSITYKKSNAKTPPVKLHISTEVTNCSIVTKLLNSRKC